MAKEEEKKVDIKAKKVAKNLVVMVGTKKFIVPNVTDKEVDSIQNKILLYNKNKSDNNRQKIMDIIDISTKIEDKEKSEIKGLKKVVKKAEKEEKSKIPIKKAATKKVIEKAKKVATKKKGVDYSELITIDKKGNMVMKGCETIPMPTLLTKRIEEFIDKEEDITPLLNFWSLSLLNPNEVARTKFFDYLSNNGLTITPSGYVVTYRMVKTTSKAGVYTDAHTKTMRYTPGTVCSIPRETCDEDGSRDCSRGLHTGTPLFIGIKANKKVQGNTKGILGDGYEITTKEADPQSYGTGYNKPSPQVFDHTFGNQAIICLINPMHVVSIPNSDTRKMRSCEFYFAKLTTAEEVIDMVEKDYLLFDGDYQSFELKQLQELLKNKELKAYVDEKTDKGAKIHKLEAALKKKMDDIKISNDKISNALDPVALKLIIKQRLKVIK